MSAQKKTSKFVHIPVRDFLPQTEPDASIEHFLAGLPIIEWQHVIHCGEPATHEITHGNSLEGCLLSVSTDPEAWQVITHVGHLEWKLSLPKGSFQLIAMWRLRSGQRRALTSLGVRLGLLQLVTRYRASHYDSEVEETRYTDHLTRKEALDESGGETRTVSKVNIPSATTTLDRYWTIRGGNRAGTHLAEDALIAYLAEWGGKHHGLWWEERLDPVNFSAPRGGIFQSVVPYVRIKRNI